MELKRERDPPKSVAEYFNCEDYKGRMKNRGKGIRKWRMVENKEWTLKEDFVEKLNVKISRWVDSCAKIGGYSSLKDDQEEGAQDPPQFIWVKGNRYRFWPEGTEEEKKAVEEDVVDHHQGQRSLSFKDACVGTDDYWASKGPSTWTPPASRPQSQTQLSSNLLGPLPYLQPYTSTTAVSQQPPSLLGAYVPPHLRQQQLDAHPSSWSGYQNQFDKSSGVDKSEFEKAKSWKPKNEDQRAALEQAKLDIFNVLVVGKGCNAKGLMKEFFRVTEENLDLGKIGVPDVRTLLVQMTDMIYLKKERSSGKIFIFANLANSQFERVAHIGELVAEQRKDKFFMIPDSSALKECEITDLFQFQEQHQTQWNPAAPFHSPFNGNWTIPNVNNDFSSYYQNFNDGGGVGGGSQVDLYAQALSQQLNYYTHQYYANYQGYYNGHHGGHSYYRGN